MSEKTGGFFVRSNEPCTDRTGDSRRGRDLSAGLMKERKSQMKRNLRDHSFMNLLPSGETNEIEIKPNDQILMNTKAA